jgi:hypothetical protein
MDAEPMTPRELNQYASMANDEIRLLQKAMRRTLARVRQQEEAIRRAKHLLRRDPFGAWMVASDNSIPRT